MDEGDKTRHRISRQADERRAADDSHRDRTSRLDRHPPQHQRADAFDTGLDVVFFAGRNAAGGQDQIVACRRPSSAPRASDARSSLRMPRSLTSQPSRSSIAISMKRLESNSCAAARGAPRRHQFVAGRKHRDADAPAHLELASGRTPPRARHPAAAAAGLRPARTCPAGMSSPAGRTLAPGLRPAGQNDLAVVIEAHVLLHEHGVGAIRHRRAGENPHRRGPA